jgi:hypothetical protein
MKVPPILRAQSQLNNAVRAPPMCRYPVGDGANRRRGFVVIGDERVRTIESIRCRIDIGFASVAATLTMPARNTPESRTALRLLSAHRMPRDLDDELLRVARDYVAHARVESFTCDDLSRFILDARPGLRLAHPYLHGLIEALAGWLARDDLLERDGASFRLTERARAYLEREPELLIEQASCCSASDSAT